MAQFPTNLSQRPCILRSTILRGIVLTELAIVDLWELPFLPYNDRDTCFLFISTPGYTLYKNEQVSAQMWAINFKWTLMLYINRFV